MASPVLEVEQQQEQPKEPQQVYRYIQDNDRRLNDFLSGREFETGPAARMPLKDLARMVTAEARRAGWSYFGPAKPIAESELKDVLREKHGRELKHLKRVTYNTRIRSGMFVIGMQPVGASSHKGAPTLETVPLSKRSPLEYVDWQDRWALDCAANGAATGKVTAGKQAAPRLTTRATAHECPCGYVTFDDSMRVSHEKSCPSCSKEGAMTSTKVMLRVVSRHVAVQLRPDIDMSSSCGSLASEASDATEFAVELDLTPVAPVLSSMAAVPGLAKGLVDAVLEASSVSGKCVKGKSYRALVFQEVMRGLAKVSPPDWQRAFEQAVPSPDAVADKLDAFLERFASRRKSHTSANEQPGVSLGQRVFKLTAYRCLNPKCPANSAKKMWLSRQTAYTHRKTHPDCATSVEGTVQHFVVQSEGAWEDTMPWDHGLDALCKELHGELLSIASSTKKLEALVTILFRVLTEQFARHRERAGVVRLRARADADKTTLAYKVRGEDGWGVFKDSLHALGMLASRVITALENTEGFDALLAVPVRRHGKPVGEFLKKRGLRDAAWLASMFEPGIQALFDEQSAAFFGRFFSAA